MLKMKASITFPCSQDDWNRLCALHKMFDKPHPSSPALAATNSDSDNLQLEEITKEEKNFLDEMSKKTHEEGDTPLMNALEESSERKGRKPDPNSVASLTMVFLKNNNNCAHKRDIVQWIKACRDDMSHHQVVAGVNAIGQKKKIIKDGNGFWSLIAQE